MVGPGASGSCRCSTSKPSSRMARIVRSWADGSGATGATEPLAAVGTLTPSGVTPASGGTPSAGASTRVGCPLVRRARASESTWPWTPPGMVTLYGQRMPTFTPDLPSRSGVLLRPGPRGRSASSVT